jgi:acid phosphatase family membrane protein YuiD
MLRQYLFREIALVPVICGFLNQCLKVALYSIVFKRVTLYKFVQADGLPNLHSAVFGSLSASIGIKYGFSSILFSFVAVMSVIVVHDTMRLKGEKGKQSTVLNRIISSDASYRDIADEGPQRVLRFTPFDVLSGTFLGAALAFALL